MVMEIERDRRARTGLRRASISICATPRRAAIALYETLGYRRWGTHPRYARVDGEIVPGHYYYKRLDEQAP